MMLQPHSQLAGIQAFNALPPHRGKRKADGPDNNERLSKRLSLLNLEQGGQRLYVPVEGPGGAEAGGQKPPFPVVGSRGASPRRPRAQHPVGVVEPVDGSMELDDTKHKVYIYNLDDELSSESEAEDGKLVFLPDIEKHLRDNRIPPSVLASPDGELAGMQLVLYSEPASLSVPEEQDSVRKAIVEARARVREKQREERDTMTDTLEIPVYVPPVSPPARPRGPPRLASDFRRLRSATPPAAPTHDPDAMDLD